MIHLLQKMVKLVLVVLIITQFGVLEILYVQRAELDNITMFLDIIVVQETQHHNNSKQRLKELAITVDKEAY